MRWTKYVFGACLSVLAACSGLPIAGNDPATSTDDYPPATLGPPPLTFPPAPDEPQPMGPEEISELFGRTTVRVFSDSCGELASGSGFAVTDQHVVTNAHVAGGDISPVLRLRDGSEVGSVLIGYDIALDIAVLQTGPDTFDSVVSWADSDEVTEGQPLTVIGYPNTGDYDVLEVRVRSRSTESGIDVIRVSGGVDSGNSGSPAFDGFGQVAGVVRAVDEGNYENFGVLVPSLVAFEIARVAVNEPVTYTSPCVDTPATSLPPETEPTVAPFTSPPSSATPTTIVTSVRGEESVGTELMVLASANGSAEAADVSAETERLSAIVPGVRTLASNDWPSTFGTADRLIFYVGGFASSDDVRAECSRLGLPQPDNCYPRLLNPES